MGGPVGLAVAMGGPAGLAMGGPAGLAMGGAAGLPISGADVLRAMAGIPMWFNAGLLTPLLVRAPYGLDACDARLGMWGCDAGLAMGAAGLAMGGPTGLGMCDAGLGMCDARLGWEAGLGKCAGLDMADDRMGMLGWPPIGGATGLLIGDAAGLDLGGAAGLPIGGAMGRPIGDAPGLDLGGAMGLPMGGAEGLRAMGGAAGLLAMGGAAGERGGLPFMGGAAGLLLNVEPLTERGALGKFVGGLGSELVEMARGMPWMGLFMLPTPSADSPGGDGALLALVAMPLSAGLDMGGDAAGGARLSELVLLRADATPGALGGDGAPPAGVRISV